MKLIRIFLNCFKFKKTSQLSDIDNNLKFSKGDRVVIVTRAYDDLKYRVGSIVTSKESTIMFIELS